MRRGLVLRLGLCLAVAAACSELKSAPDAGDTGTPSDGGALDAGPTNATDGSAPAILDADVLPPEPDAEVGPSEPCRPTPPECLDAARDDVIEVPTESSFPLAISTAPPNTIIQLRGGSIAENIGIPSFVSLRGCENADLTGEISLAGGQQSVEGFYVTGRIFLNASGTFTISRNRFAKPIGSIDERPSIRVSTLSPATKIEIELSVLDSTFVSGPAGIHVLETDNAGAKGVSLTVANSVFSRVAAPIVLSRSAPSLAIKAAVISSTFYDFETAISLEDLPVTATVTVDASLFVKGKVGITGLGGSVTSGYRLGYSFVNEVVTPSATPPIGEGRFIEVAPDFVDSDKSDLRLKRGSLAVNRIPSIVAVPSKDMNGCPRPEAKGSAIDPGAFESQPSGK